mgnify:CR=1 FL=1
MFKGLAGLGDMTKMMQQAKDMQDRVAEMQQTLATMTVTGESGAGLVTATATAKGDLTALDFGRHQRRTNKSPRKKPGRDGKTGRRYGIARWYETSVLVPVQVCMCLHQQS